MTDLRALLADLLHEDAAQLTAGQIAQVVALVVGAGWMPTMLGGEHHYISTACLHGQHDKCGYAQRARGEDDAPHCKHCPAVCACPECKHQEGAHHV